MAGGIDFEVVPKVDDFKNLFLMSAEDHAGYEVIEKRALDFLISYAGWPTPTETYIGAYCPPIFAIFLFRLDKQALIDAGLTESGEWIWVVVGDLPPAYLRPEWMPEGISDGVKALTLYVAVARLWTEAVEEGRSVEEYSNLYAPADKEHAAMLRTRFELLMEFFLSNENAAFFPDI